VEAHKTETTHTRGPWIANHTHADNGKFKYGVRNQTSDNPVFDWKTSITRNGSPCYLGTLIQAGARDHAEAEANANLIAAAPELLEALDDIIGLAKAGRIVHIENRAKAAIAKAKGESIEDFETRR